MNYWDTSESRYTAMGHYRGRWGEDTSMVTLTPEHVYFNQVFDQIKDVVEPRCDWDTGNGYFMNAVRKTNKLTYVNLWHGETAKSTHISKRKIIFLGTKLGTLAIFEAATPGNRNNRITMYGSAELMASGLVSFQDLASVERMRNYVFNSKDEPGALLREIRVYAEAKQKALDALKG